MGLSSVSPLLLVLLSVLALTRAQTTTQTSADITTTESTNQTSADINTTESTTQTTADTTTTEPETTQTTGSINTTTTTVIPETSTTETTTTETTTTTLPETTTETTTVLPETTTFAPISATTDIITTEAVTTTESTEPATTTSTTTFSTTTLTTTAWTAPEIFYPFGPAAGDGEQFENGGETFVNFTFSNPFMYFGRKYNYIYVNNNGLLTFNRPIPEAHPFFIPTYGADDFIAALWTDLDDIGLGKYWFQQYTNGSVLTRATQDINQYFPQIGFVASSVFVVTWDYVQTWDINVFNLHSAPTITFQVVLISGGGFSFILMNYGDCADVGPYPVEAGYDTIGSTDYHLIHYANDGYSISNLKTVSNINVPGRWAFLVNNGTENVLGVQIKLSSFLDLTQTGNIEDVLQQIKHVLVQKNVSSFFEIKLRNVKKTYP